MPNCQCIFNLNICFPCVLDSEFLAAQAKCYVEGIQWILHYYYHGVQSWSWWALPYMCPSLFYFPPIPVTLSCQIMDEVLALQEVVFLWENEPVKQYTEAKGNKNNAFFHCFPSLALCTFFCFEIPLELMVVSTGTTPTTMLPSCLTSGMYQDWNSRLTLENPSCHSSNCWRSCQLPARSCCLMLTG